MSRERVGGGRRESASTRQERGVHGVGGQGGVEGEKMIVRNSSPGRCGAEGIIQTLPSLSPLPHLVKRACESPRVRHAGPLRGQSKTPRLHSRLPAVKGPTTAGRHLASHGWLISAGGEEEEEEDDAEEERGVSFSEPQKYYTSPFIILSMPPPSVVSLHSSVMFV